MRSVSLTTPSPLMFGASAWISSSSVAKPVSLTARRDSGCPRIASLVSCRTHRGLALDHPVNCPAGMAAEDLTARGIIIIQRSCTQPAAGNGHTFLKEKSTSPYQISTPLSERSG
jgi:hypothetical protein